MTRIVVTSLLVIVMCLLAFDLTSRGVEPARSAPRKREASVPRSKITPQCQASIDRGTVWLLRAMRSDGSVGTDIGRPADLGCTAALGLALVAEGNTPTAGPNTSELRRVMDAVLNMVERVPDNGALPANLTLVQRKIGRSADLFLSTLFLTQVYGEAGDAEIDVRRGLERLVSIVAAAQGKDGTWGDESWAPVLGTVLGWECLRAADSCGLRVDASSKAAGDALLKKLKAGSTDQQDWMQSFYKNASSIRVLYSLGYRHERKFEECVDKILDIAKHDDRPFTYAGGEEYLAFFLVTECLLQEREVTWEAWYPTVRDKIMRVQNRDGSWSGHHCITARTFCTAAALLTLQAANRYMPVSDL